jgi:hypothetical protein
VDVDQPVAQAVRELGRQEAHEAGQAHDLGARFSQCRVDLRLEVALRRVGPVVD